MLWNDTGAEMHLRPRPVHVYLEGRTSEFSGVHRIAPLPSLGIMLSIKKPCVGLTGTRGLVLDIAEGETSKPILEPFLTGLSL